MRLVRWVNLALWIGLGAGNVVKIVGEAKEGMGTRLGLGYEMGEEMAEVGVMVGVYVAIAVLELVS